VTAAEIASLVGAIGGPTALVGAAKWWLERSERLRREDLAREDARSEASARRYEAMGAAMTATAETLRSLATAIERTPIALDQLGGEVAAMHRTIAVIEARLVMPTSEHRAGGVS
jgi:hypothetical protein